MIGGRAKTGGFRHVARCFSSTIWTNLRCFVEIPHTRQAQSLTTKRVFYHVKALVNEDTLLPTQMFPRLPARATFVADTNFVSGTQKMFLILFRNILCPQQMFPSLPSPRNIMSNNVSSFASTFKLLFLCLEGS